MPTMNDNKLDSLFTLMKGEFGTRKSTQALSYPSPQYWVSSDKKMGALKIPMKAWGINSTLIEYDDYYDYNEIDKKLSSLVYTCKFKTVILDTITSTADIINLQTRSKKSGTTTKAGDEKGHRVGGIIVNTMEDYKAEASAFQDIIDKLQKIQKYHNANIVLIAHVVGERKNEGITTFARIIVTGGKIISAKIPSICQEIYHFNVEPAVDTSKEAEYALMTTHTGDDYARTSLPLARKITFNNQPLYQTYIKPAIEKLNGVK